MAVYRRARARRSRNPAARGFIWELGPVPRPETTVVPRSRLALTGVVGDETPEKYQMDLPPPLSLQTQLRSILPPRPEMMLMGPGPMVLSGRLVSIQRLPDRPRRAPIWPP